MKTTNFSKTELILFLIFIFIVLSTQNSSSQTFCTEPNNGRYAGEQDGYRYELWNQDAQGTACMTLGNGALFGGEWEGIQNYLARRGLGYDQTQKHQEIGTFYAIYNCNYNPSPASGNSYFSIYGWTVEPLAEYYIIEDWQNWIPSMDQNATLKGTINVNGSIYDIYENTRYNQPSIVGNTTFQQYFSIRRDVRNSGIINISEHFNKWESLGMKMGNMYEVSFVVEGYQSNGNFEFTELNLFASNDTNAATDVSKRSSNVTIYRNSNSGDLCVKLDEANSNANIKIYDAAGRNVFTKKNINNGLLSISNLKSGIYFINVYSNKINHTTKFLID